MCVCVIDGQAIAIKLSKQITQKTNAIKATITKYNASLKALEDWVQSLPEEIQFEQAKDPDSLLYSHLQNQPTNDNIPFTVKRSAIDLHCFLQRCKEEQELLGLEIERLFRYHLVKRKELVDYIAKHAHVQSNFARGAVAIATKQLDEINNTLFKLCSDLPGHSNEERPFSAIAAEHALLKHFVINDSETVTDESVHDQLEEEESLDFSDDSDSDNNE